MAAKSGGFLEKYIDKIVIGVAVLIAVVVLVFQVLRSPAAVELNGSKVGPGEIDEQISRKVEMLERKLEQSPEPKEETYTDKSSVFKKFLAQGMINYEQRELLVPRDLQIPIPNPRGEMVAQDRSYRIPRIGEISDVNASLFRCVAEVPVGEVGPQNPYSKADTKLEDLDFVTVQGSIDVGRLYSAFNTSFAGSTVRPEWREEQFSRPVFVSVKLERRQRSVETEPWSDWQEIGRTKIDEMRNVFDVPENISQLQAGRGIRTLMAQFRQEQIVTNLLQPEPYSYSYPSVQWLPPGLAQKREQMLEQQRLEQMRQEREAEREARRRELEEQRERQRSRRDSRTRRGGDDFMGPGMMPGMGVEPGRDSRTDRRWDDRGDELRERRERLLRERREELGDERGGEVDLSPEAMLDEILLGEDVELADQERVVFWAHDDQTEPGMEYQYRIKLGVLNPIAGTNWFDESSADKKDDVILWTDYQVAPETIEIPRRIYAFPMDVRTGDNMVTVEVAKYDLGRWYKEAFQVRPGELIGHEKELVDTSAGRGTGDVEAVKVDYSTGAMLIDVVSSAQWSGRGLLSRRDFYNMLFTYDGDVISREGIKQRFWSEQLRDAYQRVNDEMASAEEVDLSGDRRGLRRGGRERDRDFGDQPMMPGEDFMMPPDMMMEPGGRRRR